jgi:hypothetical protein
MIVFFVTMLSFSPGLPNSFADTEFEDSVPLEVVKAFLGNGPYRGTKIYSDRADALPDIFLPGEFAILVSIDRGYSIAIAVRTNLSQRESRALLADPVLGASYIEIEPMAGFDMQTRFVSPVSVNPLTLSRFFHDDLSSVSFGYQKYGSTGVSTVSSSPNNSVQDCAQQKQFTEQRLQSNGGSQQYVPRLELAKSNARNYRPFMSLGMSSGGGSFKSQTVISIDWDLE